MAMFELTLEHGIKNPQNGSLGLYMNGIFFNQQRREFGLKIMLGKLKGEEEDPSTVILNVKFPDLPDVIGQSTINKGEQIDKPDEEIMGSRVRADDTSHLWTLWQDSRITSLSWNGKTAEPSLPLLKPSALLANDRIFVTEEYLVS